jgi:hypothetical protein
MTFSRRGNGATRPDGAAHVEALAFQPVY